MTSTFEQKYKYIIEELQYFELFSRNKKVL